MYSLKSYCFYGAWWLRIAQSKGVYQGRCFSALKQKHSQLWKSCTSFKKKLDWYNPQKRRLCQLTSVVPCSLWIFWPLKLGLIGYDECGIITLHCIISEDFTGFGNVDLGLVLHGVVWHVAGSALCKKIYDNLTYLSANFKENILSCIWVNTILIIVSLCSC